MKRKKTQFYIYLIKQAEKLKGLKKLIQISANRSKNREKKSKLFHYKQKLNCIKKMFKTRQKKSWLARSSTVHS